MINIKFEDVQTVKVSNIKLSNIKVSQVHANFLKLRIFPRKTSNHFMQIQQLAAS